MCAYYALNLLLVLVYKNRFQTSSGIRISNFKDEPFNISFNDEGNITVNYF